MSSPCSVCSHRESAAIDALLLTGSTLRSVAVGYDLSEHAVGRHSRGHLTRPGATPALLPADNNDPIEELVGHLRNRALAGSDAAAREYRLILGQLEARNAAAPPRALADEPEWIALRARLLAALEPFPEARLAVAAALHETEGTFNIENGAA